MLKLEAEEVGDEDYRKKLLAAAKLLADATAKMVEAAKVSADKYSKCLGRSYFGITRRLGSFMQIKS